VTDRRRRDVGTIVAWLKPAIDGLRDAAVLVDDHSGIVVRAFCSIVRAEVCAVLLLVPGRRRFGAAVWVWADCRTGVRPVLAVRVSTGQTMVRSPRDSAEYLTCECRNPCPQTEPFVYDGTMTSNGAPLRVIGYVRVSTDKQEIGPEVQIDALTAEAAKMGWDLTIVREDAVSAATVSKRPLMRQALADLKAKKFDALAVQKLDRLSRSTDDGSTLLANSTRQGWAIVCLDLGVDTATIMGAGMFNMALNFAEMERRRIGERTKDGMAKIKANDPGKHMGRPSSQSPAAFDRIRHLRTTLSMAKTAAVLNAEGVPTATGGTWHASTISRIEQSTAYRRTAHS